MLEGAAFVSYQANLGNIRISSQTIRAGYHFVYQFDRYGAVGHVYICGANFGGLQRSSTRVGATFGPVVAQLGGRIRHRGHTG